MTLQPASRRFVERNVHNNANYAENLLESIFSITDEALIVTDHEFKKVKYNRACAKFLPEVFNDAFSLESLKLQYESGNPLVLSSLVDLPHPQDAELELPDGTRAKISIAIKGLMGDTGPLYLVSIQDISERSELERILRITLNEMRVALSDLTRQKVALDQHAIVSVTDAAGVITYANDLFSKISGYAKADLIGRNHRIVRSGLHPQSYYDDIWRTITAGRIWRGEIANLSKDGNIYWVMCTIVPWFDAYGVPQAYIAIHSDITDRIVAQRALDAARKQELMLSSLIQQKLLFGTPTNIIDGLKITAYTQASQGIDGDFYAFTQLTEHCYEVMIGDVMGKGIQAAMIGAGLKSSYLKAQVECLAKSKDALPSIASIVNQLHSDLTAEFAQLETFVTFAIARVNRKDMTVSWVIAGHNPIMLASPFRPDIVELQGSNAPFGVLFDEVYVEHSRPIEVGDTLFFYSDGITECVDRDAVFFGHESLLRTLGNWSASCMPLALLLTSLRQDLEQHTQGLPFADDCTAIAAQICDLSDGSGAQSALARHRTYLLDSDPQAFGDLIAEMSSDFQDSKLQPQAGAVAFIKAVAASYTPPAPEVANASPAYAVVSRTDTRFSSCVVLPDTPAVAALLESAALATGVTLGAGPQEPADTACFLVQRHIAGYVSIQYKLNTLED